LQVARRDFEGMEQRRKRAAGMFARGATQADVARELEVSRQSVSEPLVRRLAARWHDRAEGGGGGRGGCPV